MASVKVQSVFCAGGGHARTTLYVAGTAQGAWDFDLEDIIGSPNDADRKEFARNFIRLHKIGKTNAQLKTDLEAGITVTI
jgi:hypothetical protein